MIKIVRPTFLVDETICRANIRRMADRAARQKLQLRPHFKTHQSATIGEWFRQAGVQSITVSSVQMAAYFASHGWEDITIAFPVNVLEIEEINRLAQQIKLNLLVENTSALSLLKKEITSEAGLYIEIDTGYFRSGIEINRVNQADELLALLKGSPQLQFRGFLSHTGQTYSARSADEISVRHADALMKLRSLKAYYRAEWPDLEISLGDTPACSVCDQFDGVDEIRPGNFVFYDLMQQQLGVCSPEDIAVSVACPVVSRHLSRNEVVIYGGAVHLSKEFILRPEGKRTFGRVAVRTNGRLELLSEETYVSALSQEHGIIRTAFTDIDRLQVGSLVEIIPVHSCLTADLAGCYYTTSGKKIEKMVKT